MATVAETIPADQRQRVARPLPWKVIAWFGALLFLSYAPVLYRLGSEWLNNEDMGHGFFVPIVAGYIVWTRRDALAAIRPKTNYWGLLLVLWGALQFLFGTLGAERFLAQTAFIISLAGAVLFLGGTRMFKLVAFPIFLLFFMIPIPAIIYGRLTLPLQLFASRVAETILGLFNIPVLRDGNVLELASQKLNVVEACSGIRSLLSLSFLSLIYAHFFDRKSWMRWALLAATIPIAIAANAARVTITGMLSEIRTDLAQGFFHTAEGWILFVFALILLISFHRFLNFLYKRFHKEDIVHA